MELVWIAIKFALIAAARLVRYHATHIPIPTKGSLWLK